MKSVMRESSTIEDMPMRVPQRAGVSFHLPGITYKVSRAVHFRKKAKLCSHSLPSHLHSTETGETEMGGKKAWMTCKKRQACKETYIRS